MDGYFLKLAKSIVMMFAGACRAMEFGEPNPKSLIATLVLLPHQRCLPLMRQGSPSDSVRDYVRDGT